MYIIYSAAAGLFDPPSEGCLQMVWEGPGLLQASQEGAWQQCHFWEGVLVLEGNSLACLTASSLDDVDVDVLSNRLLRAKNLAFLGFSQSLSSELPLVVPLAISNLALAHLGNALLLGGGGSGVEVFQIWLIHLSLLAATSCCC